MILTALAVLTGIILSAVIYWYIKWYRYLGKLNISGPIPLPLVGSAFEFGDSTTFLPVLHKLVRKHGDVVKLMLGMEPMLLVADYKMVERIASSTKLIDKSTVYRFLHNWIEHGLLTSTGEKWRKRRKLITPTFHFQILEQFIDVFDSVSNILVQQMEKEVGKGSTDIYPYITSCALDIIAETAMGTKINAQTDTESEYAKYVKQMCKIVVERAFSPVEQFDFLYLFTKNARRERKALKYLHNYTNSVINTRRESMAQSTNKETKEDEFGKKRRVAFLDLLLEATVDGKLLTNNDIREEVDTFMFEGHDTTASAMSFALYAIATNPEAQLKIIKEQKEIFGEDPERPSTYRDLQDMKYLEMVIKEVLRLYPSVPFYGREAAEDFKYGDLTIKKGMQLVLLIQVMQRNPEYFPEPDKFDPERFSSDNQQGNSPFTYLPFSAGLRNCIGQKFAMLEMKSTISKVCRRYVLEPVVPAHKLELVAETILKSQNGILLKVKHRQWTD